VGTLLRILTCLVLAACAATDLPESTTDVDTRSTVPDRSLFTLGPNDLLYVAVFGQPEASPPPTGVRVAPDGTLSLPLVGTVEVEGRSPDELRQVIEAGLTRYLREPSVSVAVMEYASRRYFVFGEVKDPGPKVMDRPVSALEALAMGGGFKAGANRERVVIMRRHGDSDVEVIPFNGETPGPDGLVQVRPDDFVFIGQAGVGVFSESIQPYLQGAGYTMSQIASVALAYDRLYNN
jgi:polysaccharide export outer membrane protein